MAIKIKPIKTFNKFGQTLEQKALEKISKKILNEGIESLDDVERSLFNANKSKFKQVGLEGEFGLENKRNLTNKITEDRFQHLNKIKKNYDNLDELIDNDYFQSVGDTTTYPSSKLSSISKTKPLDGISPKMLDYNPTSEMGIIKKAIPEVVGTPSPKIVRNFDEIIEGEIVEPKKLIEYVKKTPGGYRKALEWIKNNPKKAAGLTTLGLMKAVMDDGSSSEPPVDSQIFESSNEINKVPASIPVINEQEGSENIKQKSSNLLETILKQQNSTPPEQSQLQDLDVGEGGINVMEGLRQAQEQEQKELDMANLARIADMVGGAISGEGQKLAPIYDQMEKQAGRHVSRFKEMVAAQELDPDSPMSKMFNDYAKRLGFNIKGRMSLAQAKDLMPKLAQMFEKDQEREFKAEENEANRELRKAQIDAYKASKDQSKSFKEEKEKDQFSQKLRKEISSGVMGKQYSNYLNADRATKAITEFANNPSGYSDYGSLMTGLKALQGDESVVREAEMKLGIGAASLIDKLKNYVDSQMSGKTLQPGQRQDMIESAKVLADISKDMYLNSIRPVLSQASSKNIDINTILPPDLVQRHYEIQDTKEQDSAQQIVKIRNKKTGSTKLVPKDKANQYLKNYPDDLEVIQ